MKFLGVLCVEREAEVSMRMEIGSSDEPISIRILHLEMQTLSQLNIFVVIK